MNAVKTRREYNAELLESAVNALDSLPATPPQRALSAREMVIEMSGKIRERIEAGYTYQQIVEALAEAGFKIGVGTLKTYLSSASKQIDKKQQRQKRTAKPVEVNSEVNEKVNQSVTFAAKPEVTQVQRPAVPPRPPAFQDPDEK